MANKGGFIGQDGLNAPDSPTGVSGSAGQGQVEVSFTAPSDVGGSAITGYQVQSNNGDGTWYSSYDIANASYDSESFSVSSQETTTRAFTFKADGTEMYVIGFANDTVYQYTLSTAWDISTASYASKSFSVASQDTQPHGIQFKSDGTKMFMVGQSSNNVYQYSLSSAWDVSTASYDSVSFSISTQVGTTNVSSLFFSADGTNMYVGGTTNDTIYQYTLSSAWDLSTASYASKSLSVASEDTNPRGIFFKPDGSLLFVSGINDDEVLQYSLSTSWDLATATFDNISFSVASQDGTPMDVHFSTNGGKMFILGDTNDAVFQYTTGQVDYPTASPVTITGLTNGTSYTFNVWAINAFGWSSPSDASASVSPIASLAVSIASDDSNVMDYVQIQTTGNATDWGDWGSSASGTACGGSATRGLGADSNVEIDFITYSTQGNSVNFGNLSVSRRFMGCASNSTRCVWAGGNSSGFNNQMDYVNPATTGNATDFGDIQLARNGLTSSICNSVYGLFGGGQVSGTEYALVDVITIATTGNSSNYGNLSQSLAFGAGAASSTRGLHAGGTSGGGTVGVVNIYYTTISSSGSWTSFGNLTQGRTSFAGTSDTTRAVFMGGERTSPTRSNRIDYVTIASTGNAIDFGDLTVTKRRGGVCGNAHGGLQ